MDSVLLDTSFLITLTKSDRFNHKTAKTYYKRFIFEKIPMFLSTIVVSEFQVRQQISDLGVSNFIVLPFNFDHAVAAASLTDQAMASKDASHSRVSLKDDIKILGQCEAQGITHFVTDDSAAAKRFVKLKRSLPGKLLPFPIDCSEEFSEAWFTPGNQEHFEYE